MTKKKSTFQTIAEAMVFEKLGNMKLSTNHMNKRKLSIDEIKVLIREGFADAKKSADTKAKEAKEGWGNEEVENQIEWGKALKLKEFFSLVNEGPTDPPWDEFERQYDNGEAQRQRQFDAQQMPYADLNNPQTFQQGPGGHAMPADGAWDSHSGGAEDPTFDQNPFDPEEAPTSTRPSYGAEHGALGTDVDTNAPGMQVRSQMTNPYKEDPHGDTEYRLAKKIDQGTASPQTQEFLKGMQHGINKLRGIK